MIETVENALQLAVTGVCSAISFTFAYRTKEREWDILGLFYAAISLGNLYWLLYQNSHSAHQGTELLSIQPHHSTHPHK